jgi:hypothetical protein
MRPLVIAAALGIASCSDPCPHMHFERLREADQAVITVGTGWGGTAWPAVLGVTQGYDPVALS